MRCLALLGVAAALLMGCEPEKPAQSPQTVPVAITKQGPKPTILRTAIGPHKKLRLLGGYKLSDKHPEHDPYLAVEFGDGNVIELTQHRLSPGDVTAVAFTEGDHYVMAGNDQGQLSSIRVPDDWTKDPDPDGTMIYRGKDVHKDVAISALASTPLPLGTVANAVIGFDDGAIRLWNIPKNETQWLKIPRPVRWLGASVDPNVLVAIDDQWRMYRWSKGTNGKPTNNLLRHVEGYEFKSAAMIPRKDALFVTTEVANNLLSQFVLSNGRFQTDVAGKGGEVAVKDTYTLVSRDDKGVWREEIK